MKTPDLSYIQEDLRPLAYPIEKLSLLPGNPRKGNVDAVVASVKQFGQRKPVVAVCEEDEETGIVIAGNTTLQAMRKLGFTHIAVTWSKDDEKTAAAFAVADNHTHDMGEYDDKALAEMVAVFEDDLELVDATGYDLVDIQEIIDGIQLEEAELDLSDLSSKEEAEVEVEEDSAEEPQERKQFPVIQYPLVFENEDQQARWFGFLRWLKKQFPDEDTISGRLDAFLREVDGFDY